MHFKLSIIKTNFIKFKELSKLMGSTEIIKFKQKKNPRKHQNGTFV